MMKTGVMICGHGSRDPEATAEFARMAARLKARLPESDVEHGYLEFARPTIREGFAMLAARRAQRILAVPVMLLAARHVTTDLPSEINRFSADFPQIEMCFGRALSIEPKLLNAAIARIEEGERRGTRAATRTESLLLVIGRGANDPEANADIGTLARTLREAMGFGRAEVSYSGTAAPLTEPALRQAATLGFKRIVVFPYFLFTGVLVKRIGAACDRVAADHPAIEIIKTPYLGDHPLLLDCLLDRIAEIIDSTPASTM
ncbi:MAG TPA: sirohydrochlorin chelatase [Stellaceae bacterium]|jgi:sirohydrochlorin cobaltochelatase